MDLYIELKYLTGSSAGTVRIEEKTFSIVSVLAVLIIIVSRLLKSKVKFKQDIFVNGVFKNRFDRSYVVIIKLLKRHRWGTK